MIDRRELLEWSAACLATLAISPGVSFYQWLGATGFPAEQPLRDASEAMLGRACLEAIGTDTSGRIARRAQELLPLASPGLDHNGRALFRELRRQDFQQGRTVNVRGWIFAETEVGLWLTVAAAKGTRATSGRSPIWSPNT